MEVSPEGLQHPAPPLWANLTCLFLMVGKPEHPEATCTDMERAHEHNGGDGGKMLTQIQVKANEVYCSLKGL